MNNSSSAQGDFFWIELPREASLSSGSFILEPDIPLPVEKKCPEEDFKIDKTSWDEVVSAILLLLSFNPGHHYADYYRKLVFTLKPEIIINLKEASESSLKDGDFSRAEHILLALQGLAPNDSTILHDLALFYDQKARHMQNFKHYEQALDSEKSAALAYETLLLESNTKYKPQSIAWFNAGKFYYRIGEFTKALEKLEYFQKSGSDKTRLAESRKLIELCRGGGQATATYEEAFRLLNRGEIQEGYLKAKEFYQHHRENWPASFLLGWALRLLGNWQPARETLLEAYEKGCNESELFNEIALCSRELGDYTNAEKMLREGLKKSPDNIKIISNLGILKMELGQIDEACQYFRIALTLEPEDAVCLKYLQKCTNS